MLWKPLRLEHSFGFDDQSIATALLAAYPRQTESWRVQARQVLLSRGGWARAFLAAVDANRISAANVTLEELNRFAALRSADLAALGQQALGSDARGQPERTSSPRFAVSTTTLRAGPGDLDRGRRLFRDRCATCHRLFGEGETIGPDLSYANRHDRDFLLISLVDPSGVVRKEYQAYQMALSDGRVLSGLVVEQTAEAITLARREGYTISRRCVRRYLSSRSRTSH